MPQPPAYTRTKDFTVDFGSETDHSALNAELDNASNSINDIRTNIAILQADDGNLRPSVVTTDSVSADLKTYLINQAAQGAADAAATANTKAAEASASASAALNSQNAASASASAALNSQNAAATSANNSAAYAASIDPATLVKLSGDQTISGIKTFSSPPLVPTQAAGESSTKAASTAFVGAAVANLGLPAAITGNALDFLRVKADETGYEHRTPSQVLADIGALNQAAGDTLYAPLSAGKQIKSVTASVAENALTATYAGGVLDFRSATPNNGTPITGVSVPALSITVPSGATLGTVSGQPARLIHLVAYNAGTPVLCIVNLAGGNQLDETNLISPTTISSGSNSANVIYSASAVAANSPYRIVNFTDITEAAAGTWATAPTLVQGTGGQALAALSAFGYGQTWQSVTRVAGTTYYNQTGKTIFIRAGIQSGGVTSGNLTIDTMTFTMIVNNSSNYASFPVGPGKPYSYTGSIDISHEFR